MLCHLRRVVVASSVVAGGLFVSEQVRVSHNISVFGRTRSAEGLWYFPWQTEEKKQYSDLALRLKKEREEDALNFDSDAEKFFFGRMKVRRYRSRPDADGHDDLYD
jgi:hypothetical protein